MNPISRRLLNLFKYQEAFGDVAGLRAFLRKRKKSGLLRIDIPTAAHPLYMRAKTSDVYMFEEVFVEHEYEIASDLRPSLIIDAGANVGYASVFFANRYPDAAILAVEPDRSNVEILRMNVAPYPNVRVVEAAVWHQPATLVVEDHGDKSGIQVHPPKAGRTGQEVQALTVDQLLAMVNAPRVDILKIDIEGSEKELFEHPQAWLADVGMLMIELHDRFKPGCSRAVYSALVQHDFREMRHRTANWFVNGGRG